MGRRRGREEGREEGTYITMERLARIFRRAGEGVREVVGSAGLVPVHAHGAVSLVVADAGVEGTVDGDLLEVRAEPVAVGISIRKQATLILGL